MQRSGGWVTSRACQAQQGLGWRVRPRGGAQGMRGRDEWPCWPPMVACVHVSHELWCLQPCPAGRNDGGGGRGAWPFVMLAWPRSRSSMSDLAGRLPSGWWTGFIMNETMNHSSQARAWGIVLHYRSSAAPDTATPPRQGSRQSRLSASVQHSAHQPAPAPPSSSCSCSCSSLLSCPGITRWVCPGRSHEPLSAVPCPGSIGGHYLAVEGPVTLPSSLAAPCAPCRWPHPGAPTACMRHCTAATPT